MAMSNGQFESGFLMEGILLMDRVLTACLFLFTVLLGVAATANGEDVQCASHANVVSTIETQNLGCGAGESFPWAEPCLDCGAWFVDAEVTFFRYHRADGVRVGDTTANPGDEDVEFDFDASPRITLGYVKGYRGLRVRWWDHNHSAAAFGPQPDQVLSIDTYTIDVEFFQTTEIGCQWNLELSAGVRYNDFEEVLRDGPEFRINAFDGAGLVVGLESRHSIGCHGDFFIRGRGAMLMDDKFVSNSRSPSDRILLDSVQSVAEVALGYEYTRCLQRATLVLGASVEMQQWFNYSSAFDRTAAGVVGSNQEDFFDGQSDVGFGGFVLSAEVLY